MFGKLVEFVRKLFGTEKPDRRKRRRTDRESPTRSIEGIKLTEKLLRKPSIADETPVSAPSKIEPLEVKEGLKERRFINVGIDFGTSGTKVIYRDIIGKKAWVCGFNHALKDYPNFVLPSSLRIIGKRIYFGSEAERRTQNGNAIRSFKICMVCQNGLIPKEACNLIYDTSLHPKPQTFQFTVDTRNSIFVSPLELGTYYIAYVIEHVKEQVKKRFGNTYDINITFNMCIPIDYLQYGYVKEAFNRSLFFANYLSGSIKDGSDLAELKKAFKELDDNFQNIPGPEDRSTFVQPETIVAIFSYVMSPLADDGLYAIADVGAGTTDIAFFRLSKFFDNTLAIYNAQTHIVGANDVDSVLFKFLEEKGAIPESTPTNVKSELIQSLRIHKQRISDKSSERIRIGEGEFQLSREDFNHVATPIARKVFSRYQGTWRGAYKKEQKQSRWETYTLFRIGGGSKIPVIGKKLSEKPWDGIGRIIPKDLQFPTDLVYEDVSHQSKEDSFGLMAIAYGLSYHPAMYPKIIMPGGVPEMTPELPIKNVPPWYQYWEQD
jgi:hypothetical protein